MTVTATAVRPYPKTLHPIHATLLAGTVPLFLGALLSDLAYWSSHQVQWANFASWLTAGGVVFAGLALLCALAGLFRARGGERRPIYFLLLLAIWILGFISALVHARDAWAAMPTGLVLSAIVTVLAIAATGVGLSRRVGAAA